MQEKLEITRDLGRKKVLGIVYFRKYILYLISAQRKLKVVPQPLRYITQG